MDTVVCFPRVAPTRFYAVTTRTLLLSLSVFALVVGLFVGEPSEGLRRDADMVFLLRSMSFLKGAIVFGMLAFVWWRLRIPSTFGVAASYVATVAIAIFSAALMWQLSFLGWVSFLFHISLIGLALFAWRDPQVRTIRTHRDSCWGPLQSCRSPNLRRMRDLDCK